MKWPLALLTLVAVSVLGAVASLYVTALVVGDLSTRPPEAQGPPEFASFPPAWLATDALVRLSVISGVCWLVSLVALVSLILARLLRSYALLLVPASVMLGAVLGVLVRFFTARVGGANIVGGLINFVSIPLLIGVGALMIVVITAATVATAKDQVESARTADGSK
jgi:uncharacterized membrane protein